MLLRLLQEQMLPLRGRDNYNDNDYDTGNYNYIIFFDNDNACCDNNYFLYCVYYIHVIFFDNDNACRYYNHFIH